MLNIKSCLLGEQYGYFDVSTRSGKQRALVVNTTILLLSPPPVNSSMYRLEGNLVRCQFVVHQQLSNIQCVGTRNIGMHLSKNHNFPLINRRFQSIINYIEMRLYSTWVFFWFKMNVFWRIYDSQIFQKEEASQGYFTEELLYVHYGLLRKKRNLNRAQRHVSIYLIRDFPGMTKII